MPAAAPSSILARRSRIGPRKRSSLAEFKQGVAMSNRILASIVILVLPLGLAAQEKTPARILIIRHAEKPPEGDPSIDLNAQGKERAKALHKLFETSKSRPVPFAKPDFIF